MIHHIPTRRDQQGHSLSGHLPKIQHPVGSSFISQRQRKPNVAGTPLISNAIMDPVTLCSVCIRDTLLSVLGRGPTSRSCTKFCPSTLPAPPPARGSTRKTPLLTVTTALNPFLKQDSSGTFCEISLTTDHVPGLCCPRQSKEGTADTCPQFLGLKLVTLRDKAKHSRNYP
jgi:hypothetical protein